MSFFKSKRSDTKSSKSSTSSDSKQSAVKGAASAAAPSGAAVGSQGGSSASSLAPSATGKKDAAVSGKQQRSMSIDTEAMNAWMDTECPLDPSRLKDGTMDNNKLSISRSGRYKAKGKMRARLFSEEASGYAAADQDDPALQLASAANASRHQSLPTSDGFSPVATVFEGGGKPVATNGKNIKSQDLFPTNSEKAKWSSTSHTTPL